jgi:adenosylcobinamide-GDP ribazoletransferase
VTGFVRAVRYLTIVPMPGRPVAGPVEIGQSALWFPVVGFILGITLAGIDFVTARLFPGLLGALLTVTAWKLLTGGLHLDGLADRLAIMRDSRIGTFGAVGLILFLMLEIVTVAELSLVVRWRALVVVPTLARALPPLLARCFPSARPTGQGAAFMAGVGAAAAPLAAIVATLVAVLTLRAAGVAALVVALAVGFVVAWFQSRRLGGLTGDVFGAVVELSELAALLTVLAWLSARP